MSNKSGKTRQGVRDLGYGKSKGKRLQEVPCTHPSDKIKHFPLSGDKKCLECGATWDYEGKEI